jgi:hypothetical protein
MNFDFGSMIGSSAGGALVVFLAQFYFQRCFKEMDNVIKSMNEVKSQLAAVAVKIANAEGNDQIIRSHDRKIAKLEERLNTLGTNNVIN